MSRNLWKFLRHAGIVQNKNSTVRKVSVFREIKMVRLCLPWGGFIKYENRSGLHKFEGSAMKVDGAKTLFYYLKPSQMVVVRSSSNCLKRLKNNLSDVILQGFSPKEGFYYYVPEVTHAKTPAILSGYEVNEYIKNQTNKGFSKYGLLENYKAFDGEIYAAIFLLFLTVVLTKWFFNCLFRSNIIFPWKRGPRKRLRMRKRLHFQMLDFVKSLSFFLVSNAFFSLYSTSQVITEKPFVISDYESLIRSNISIYLLMSANIDEYFKPSEMNIKNNDMTYRFFNYFNKKKFSRSKDWANDDFFKYIFRFNNFAKNLADKKYVFMSHYDGARHLRSRLCASTWPNEYFRVFLFRDPSQREVLVGNAFRTGFYDAEVKKKLKIFELFNPKSSQMDAIRVMNYYLDFNVLMSRERRSQQILHCLDEKLEAYQKEATFASDFQFFKAFWITMACPAMLAFYVFLFENFKFYYLKRTDWILSPRKSRLKRRKRTRLRFEKLLKTRGPSNRPVEIIGPRTEKTIANLLKRTPRLETIQTVANVVTEAKAKVKMST